MAVVRWVRGVFVDWVYVVSYECVWRLEIEGIQMEGIRYRLRGIDRLFMPHPLSDEAIDFVRLGDVNGFEQLE